MLRILLGVVLLLAPMAAEARQGGMVSSINAKLARWVHPTGKCANEQLATMYGNDDGHLGKPLFCGGRLDSSTPVVAHKSLPCGTRLMLTNPKNGRSVGAVVRDRGPYTSAKLDLGPGVYNALGIHTSQYVCVSGI